MQVDPFWPKPLPNNWIIGQVSGVAVDKRDHVWIIHRPRSLSEREVGAQHSPPWSRCCIAAPPILVFDVVHNIAVDRHGNVYTTEVNTGQRVQKFRRLKPQN